MSTRIAFIDPVGGIAGDMLNAALIDAGADETAIRRAIASLGIAGLDCYTEAVTKGSFAARRFIVEAASNAIPASLGPEELLALARRAEVSPTVRAHAIAGIERLAAAEMQAHGVAREDVHFHELGGLDTIVDVLAACVALESLGDPQCFCGPLPVVGGVVPATHGLLPLPAPATLAIIAEAGLVIAPAHPDIPRNKELVTPTGAALLAEFATPALVPMHVLRIGTGAGTRDLPVPNVVRVWLGEAAALPHQHETFPHIA
jgi:pyridinium-3,5-bisthiocarboxylic acid mononucleotide nickel chelatase